MENILEIKNLYKRYDTKIILNNIQLQVKKGTIFGLLGPNGAGKTSLIRIINGITAPDEGEVLINHQPLSDMNSALIGYLPEERGLYKKMKVGEQVLYLARLKGLTKNDATEKLRFWFKKLEMEAWWTKKVEELSKGMQQKVQFVSTIIHEPKLLILDEPFSGFDPINAALIQKELLELKEKGVTIILSSHNMSSVEELCEDIALINKGNIILKGNVKEIKLQNSTNKYEFIFRGNTAHFTNALWSGGEILNMVNEKDYVRAEIKLNKQIPAKEIIKAIVEQVELVGFYEKLPTMNDIFIQKVGDNQLGI